jgi:hypothetical protein
MDIAARPDDPAIEEMARSIYAMFPRCMRCGEPIARYEDADVRILTHRVVHRAECGGGSGHDSAASDSVEGSAS